MSTAEKARGVLEDFLFEDILNNRNVNEQDWGITWQGDDFVLYHYQTGSTYNFAINITGGTLPPDRIQTLLEDQEWVEPEVEVPGDDATPDGDDDE